MGAGWGILGLTNYNNKYLAIAVAQNLSTSTGTSGYAQNYLRLWDGTSTEPNYSIKISGQFLGMKVIECVLYVAVQVSTTKTKLYYLDNTTLKVVSEQQYSMISTLTYSPVDHCIFSYLNNIGLRLNGSSDFNYPLMILDEQRKSSFIISSGLTFDQFCVGFDGVLYGSVYNGNTIGDVYCYLQTPSVPPYNNILYRSQWIPVQNLQAIDIYYDTPPQSGTDAINITIYGRGEDILAGSSTTTLQSITPTVFLNQKRTRLDVKGFTGDEVMVQLSTVNTGNWRAIIRKIILITK